MANSSATSPDIKSGGFSALAFLVGAALGGVVAMLYAPDKGSVTRQKIKSNLDNTKSKVEDKARETKNQAMEMKDSLARKVRKET